MQRTRAGKQAGNQATYTAMIAIPLAIFIVFFLIPNAQTIVYSLFEWDGISADKVFVGFSNFYSVLFNEPLFVKALGNTILYTAILMVLGCVSGLVLALLLENSIGVNNFFRSLFFAPAVLCAVAVGLMWKIGIYDPTIGILNTLLRQMGLKDLCRTWIATRETAIPCIVLIHAWTFMGFSMIMYISGLHSIDESLYESARIEGAGKLRVLRHITLPLLRGTTGTVVLLAIINGFTSFDYVFFITGGGSNGISEVLATLIYKQMFSYRSVGRSSAVSVLLLLTVLVFSFVQRAIQPKDY